MAWLGFASVIVLRVAKTTPHVLQRKEVVHLTTGSKALDAVMGGGVRSMEISEVFGEFRYTPSHTTHTFQLHIVPNARPR